MKLITAQEAANAQLAKTICKLPEKSKLVVEKVVIYINEQIIDIVNTKNTEKTSIVIHSSYYDNNREAIRIAVKYLSINGYAATLYWRTNGCEIEINWKK